VEIDAEIEELVMSVAGAETAKPWEDMAEDEVKELLLCFDGRRHRRRPARRAVVSGRGGVRIMSLGNEPEEGRDSMCDLSNRRGLFCKTAVFPRFGASIRPT
jgi:hypothetical protein